MKKSELNLSVIENFIDYFTTNDEERDKMKEVAHDYISEDWADGEGSAEDHIVTYGTESSFLTEDEDKLYPEKVVVVADFGEDEGTQTVVQIEGIENMETVKNLLKFIKDPYGNKM